MSGPTGIDDQDKLRNLWKQSRGVVDIHKENLYNSTSERPFVKQTLNKEIFSSDVPDSLGTVPPSSSAVNQGLPDYSVENLDSSFNAIYFNSGFTNLTYAPGTIHNLASIGYPYLDYYHRWEFEEYPSADQLLRPSGVGVATTLYIPDPSNNEIGRQKSLARNTIAFNKGGRGDYQQKFFIRNQNPPPNNFVDVAELQDPYKFVFDNQSGFILIYATDPASPNWNLNFSNTAPVDEGPLVASFIRYTGAKGAASGSGGGSGSSVGNINLVQVLELENENLKYHQPFEDIGLGNFIPPKGKYYMPIANYVIASVDKTTALAMGYFTVKIRGPSYDLVFQFMASVVNGRNPTIKVLSSNLESQIDGWGNVIMYDDDANDKWRICLGFDETEKIPVGNTNAPWTNINPSGLPPPTWWINGGQSQQTIEYIRITLVNNNANQNNSTINPIADGNWELSSKNDFRDITLAPIHSITGLWAGQPGDFLLPPSINYTYRYKVISKLALSNIDPSGNIASDTAVNVFYKDIALASDTKIGCWKFDTNLTNAYMLANNSGQGSGFWENIRTYESKYNKGNLTIEGEKINMDSKLLNIIGDTIIDGKITINGDIEHATST
ncbi:MAG: hypothetical protein L7S72_10860, partial [Flavobacteriales bacterium]|nr:hypothetical protein [Flavobacteriales bacterium]